MTPEPKKLEAAERWRLVREVFEAALDLPASERDAYLDVHCADPAMKERVEALLTADASDSSVLDTSPLPRSELGKIDRDTRIGERIGPHKIVREIDRGGMGSVYLALRDDGEYSEKVAIKLIHRGIQGLATRERFRRERQILADLDHPNIARLVDGGVTEDGLLYFVMEYIEGEPIDRYCASQSLGTAERLTLVRQVCDAVQAAHRRLVVHCDLKPSNILVTVEGVPKLLDFGIARLLDADTSEPLTRMPGSRPLTPEYASPEQIRGESISTASDVYSLGIVLYELLAGCSPYQLETRSRFEVEQIVCEKETSRPSDRVDSKSRLRRELIGDLDNIVLMALRKEPEQRYGSAEQLGEDLQRHLEGLPVRARSATLPYRMGKFLRRHAWGVLAAMLVVLSLAVGLAVASYQARIAKVREVTAERALHFLIDVFESSDPDEAGDGTLTLLDVLDEGAEKIEDELHDQPLARATLMDTIGEVYRELGRFDRAEPLLREALESRRALLNAPHEDLARSLERLGLLRHETGEYEAAESFFEASLEQFRELHGEEHAHVATGLNHLAMLRRSQGRYAEAEDYYRQALRLRRELLGEGHHDVANTLNNLGVVLRIQRRYDEAETVFQSALDLRRELFGNEHPRVASSLNNLAVLYRTRKDYERAEALYLESLAIQEQLIAEHPQVATTLSNLAFLYQEKGEPERARSLYDKALQLQKKKLPSDHPQIATTQVQLAVLLFRQGDLSGAENLWREGLAVLRARLGETHPQVIQSEKNLSLVLRSQGRLPEAEGILRQALERLENLPSPELSVQASLWVQLGRILLEQDLPLAAEEPLKRCIAARQTLSDLAGLARCRSLLGACLTQQGKLREAEPLLREGLEVLIRERSEDHPWTRTAQKHLSLWQRASS